MKTTTLVLGALLLGVFAVGPTASAASGNYVGSGPGILLCETRAQGQHVNFEEALGQNTCGNGHQFEIPDGVASVDVVIDDAKPAPADTCGFYQFKDANNEFTGPAASFNTQVTGLSVPSDAVELEVFTLGPTLATLFCNNPLAIGTVGTVTATFS